MSAEPDYAALGDLVIQRATFGVKTSAGRGLARISHQLLNTAEPMSSKEAAMRASEALRQTTRRVTGSLVPSFDRRHQHSTLRFGPCPGPRVPDELRRHASLVENGPARIHGHRSSSCTSRNEVRSSRDL